MTSLFALDAEDRGATFSPGDPPMYRYKLWRRWDPLKPSVLFVMLNPSTADADNDDLTVTKCIGYAKRWGAGGVRIVNLYAYRTAYPSVLGEALGAGIDIVAEPGGGVLNRNDNAIASAACDAGRIIAAWGAWSGPFQTRSWQVLDILRRYRDVEALALTKDSHPRHPSRLAYAVEPVIYQEARRHAA